MGNTKKVEKILVIDIAECGATWNIGESPEINIHQNRMIFVLDKSIKTSNHYNQITK